MCAVSILNLHEDDRQRPENWIPIGWMPIYDETLSKPIYDETLPIYDETLL